MLFSENINELFKGLQKDNIPFEKAVRARDFQRIIVDGKLQVDFVCDRVYREGKSNIIRRMRIDNIMNILTNKIGAILDRDEEKDIFDLFAIAYNENFRWDEVVAITAKKVPVDKSFLIERLHSFPLEWLSKIKTVKNIPIDKDRIDLMCEDILNNNHNSLITAG